MSTYISANETAKIVRQTLKANYPGVKFRVYQSSGGSTCAPSLHVRWTDGPAARDVEKLVGQFEGATFDGMTDYRGGKTHIYNGERVHFGISFLFTEWEHSPEFEQIACHRTPGYDSSKYIWNQEQGFNYRYRENCTELARMEWPEPLAANAPKVDRTY